MRNLIGMTALTGSLSMLIMIKMMIKMVMKEWIFPISSDLSRIIVPPSGTNAITPSDPTASSLSSTIPGLDSSPASSPASVSLLGKSSSHTTNICTVTIRSGIQTCGTDNNFGFNTYYFSILSDSNLYDDDVYEKYCIAFQNDLRDPKLYL